MVGCGWGFPTEKTTFTIKYISHPVTGVIAKVNPVTTKAKKMLWLSFHTLIPNQMVKMKYVAIIRNDTMAAMAILL